MLGLKNLKFEEQSNEIAKQFKFLYADPSTVSLLTAEKSFLNFLIFGKQSSDKKLISSYFCCLLSTNFLDVVIDGENFFLPNLHRIFWIIQAMDYSSRIIDCSQSLLMNFQFLVISKFTT